MAKYILKRLFMLIPVLLGISIIIFLIMRVFAPDPAPLVLGPKASLAVREQWREANGLNKPLHEQYFSFIKGAAIGDFGTSYATKEPVAKEIFSRFPATIELAVSGIAIASVFGILIGAISAVKKNSIYDNLGMLIALVGVSIPVFWLGLILIMGVAGPLHLPTGGRMDVLLQPDSVTGFAIIDSVITGDMESLVDVLKHLVLPSTVLGMYSMAIIARMTRSTMLETLNQDYIRTARAKGLPESKIIRKHALRNALIPVITVIGLQFGSLLGGAVLTETVFAWPGIGAYTVHCIVDTSDFPVVQAVGLLVAFIFVIMNLIVDVVYAFLDPRIKFSKKGE
jgi:peptide/nickel transport system permease protein